MEIAFLTDRSPILSTPKKGSRRTEATARASRIRKPAPVLIELIESRLGRTASLRAVDGVPKTPRVPGKTPNPTRKETLPPFDLESLFKQWAGDRGFIIKMIPKFQRQAESELQQIEQSLAAGDVKLMIQLAHGLKGSAGFLGARGVQESARRLEVAGRTGHLSEMNSMVAELRVEIQRCLDFSPESETAVTESKLDEREMQCKS